MRLTINLNEDLYRVAKSFAIAEDISISRAINLLLQRVAGMGRAIPDPAIRETPVHYRVDSTTGLPVVKGKAPLTDADVYRVEENEDRRHWGGGGSSR